MPQAYPFPYRFQKDGSKIVDRRHPLYRVLHKQANRRQTAFEFREQFAASCLLTGNGYALKTIDNAGRVRELIPINPGQVTVEKLKSGRLRYVVRSETGTRVFTQDEILHLKYRSKDGVTGLSPITIARETIGLAQAQQAHEGAFYRNGTTPSGVLKMDGTLSDEALATLRTK